MRLTEREIREIREAAREFFGAPVRLFGSRLDDAARGGDIDLYVETDLLPDEAERCRIAMLGRLYRRIGERRIDLLVNTGGSLSPVQEAARRTGVTL